MAQEAHKMQQYIISILLAALAAVLWYLLLETRQEVSNLRDAIIKNDLRLTTAEAQLSNAIQDVKSVMLKFDRIEIRSLPK